MTRTVRIACAVMWLCAAAAPQAQEPAKTAPKTAPATHVTKRRDSGVHREAATPNRRQPDPRG